jgi:dipeptidyl aminopeptidase/acylaminoacyl peptidase
MNGVLRVTFLLLFLSGAVFIWAQTLAPVPVAQVLASRSFAGRFPVEISPDGEWVAFTLFSQSERKLIADPRFFSYSRTGVGADADSTSLWISEVSSGRSKRLIEGAASFGGSWSPDGRHLAFYSDKSGAVALWVWSKTTGRLRQVSKAVTRTFFGYEVPQWTPDSKQVLVKLLPEGLSIESAADLLMPQAQSTTAGDKSPKVAVYTSTSKPPVTTSQTAPPADRRSKVYYSDLAMIDLATGTVRRFARGRNPTAYYLSPDGSHVVFMESTGREHGGTQQLLYDITIASTRDGRLVKVAEGVRMNYGAGVSWSPDGKTLAYVTSGPLGSGDCFLYDLSSAKTTNLSEGEHPRFGANHYRQPYWNAAGDKIYLIGNGSVWAISKNGDKPRQVNQNFDREITGIVVPNGKGRVQVYNEGTAIIVTTKDAKTKQSGFYSIDLASGAATKLIEENKEYGMPVFYLDASRDGTRIAYVSQDGSHPADVWVTDPTFSDRKRVSTTNPVVGKYVMGETKLVEWTGASGQKLRGTILLPAGYKPGTRYSVIVDVYGGSLPSNFVNRFGSESTSANYGILNTQLLATRGYAVFMPDIPMKIGSPMKDIANAVLSGIDKIIELGIADPDRLGVKGVSYGGYCTLALIVQSNRFKAAVVRSSAGGNLLSAYGVMGGSTGTGSFTGWAESGQGAMGGTPWQYRDRYIDNSPIFLFDRITTPVMIMAGTEDTATPAFLSDEIFVALQRLGKEAVYLKYKGGEHGEGSLDAEMAIDYFNRQMAWFDKYLKAPAAKKP